MARAASSVCCLPSEYKPRTERRDPSSTATPVIPSMMTRTEPGTNYATELLSVEKPCPVMQKYSELLETIKSCENQPTP